MTISFGQFARSILELSLALLNLLSFSLSWIEQALQPLPANIKGDGPFGLITPPATEQRPLSLAERLWNTIRIINLILRLTIRLVWEVVVRMLLLHWDFLDIAEDITTGIIQLDRGMRRIGNGRERTRSWYYNYGNAPPLVVGTYLIVHDRFWIAYPNERQDSGQSNGTGHGFELQGILKKANGRRRRR